MQRNIATEVDINCRLKDQFAILFTYLPLGIIFPGNALLHVGYDGVLEMGYSSLASSPRQFKFSLAGRVDQITGKLKSSFNAPSRPRRTSSLTSKLVSASSTSLAFDLVAGCLGTNSWQQS